jgi:hypothetical protein
MNEIYKMKIELVHLANPVEKGVAARRLRLSTRLKIGTVRYA